MNTIISTIVLLVFTSSFAMAQGPAQGIEMSKRATIKDSLGKVIQLADCADLLRSDSWMLHPERNEQGKVLYWLLKQTSSVEKELFTDSRVSSIDQQLFNKVKRGKFVLTTRSGDETIIRRRKKKQIESSVGKDGVKLKSKYRVFWLGDGSYILKPWTKTKDAPAVDMQMPRYKITEVTDESYTVRVVDNDFLGTSIKLTRP